MANNINKFDQIHEKLTQSVEWSARNAGWVASVVLTLIILGTGFSLFSYFDNKKEVDRQEDYYKVERAYSDKKRELAPKNTSGFKAENFASDLGTIPQDFEKVFDNYPKSRAGHMAALNLVEIYTNYGQNDKAVAVFDRLGNLNADDLTQSLLLFQKANVLANADRCADSIPAWDQLIQSKKTAFFRREAQLRKGLCLEKTGDLAGAEKIYMELAQLKITPKPQAQAGVDDSQDREAENQISTEAQKLLRLLKMKKGS